MGLFSSADGFDAIAFASLGAMQSKRQTAIGSAADLGTRGPRRDRQRTLKPRRPISTAPTNLDRQHVVT